MKAFLHKAKIRLKSLFPMPLPVGMKELDKFSDDLIFAFGMPDYPSYRQMIATMIMHADQGTNKHRAYNMIKAMRKSMANQVAYEKIQIIQRAEKEKEEALKPKEVVSEITA